jgi:hypothetical protein
VVAVTVIGDRDGRVDHGPYIAAIGRDLEARDIRVAESVCRPVISPCRLDDPVPELIAISSESTR